MEETLTRIREAAANRNKASCGLPCLRCRLEAQRRIAEGWQFIAVSSELKFMLEGAGAIVAQLNPERTAGEMAKY